MILIQKEERKRALLDKAPLVEVKLLEGNAIESHMDIKINAFGYANSWREDSEDHYVYFGSCAQMNGKVINDVVC